MFKHSEEWRRFIQAEGNDPMPPKVLDTKYWLLGLVTAIALASIYQILLWSSHDSGLDRQSDNPVILAVLPFQHGGDEHLKVRSSGLREDLLRQLSAISALRVLAGAAVTREHEAHASADEAARSLNATHFLTGSVTWKRDFLHVKLELFKQGAQNSIWSEEYNLHLDIDAILKARAGVVTQIASVLKTAPTPNEKDRITNAPTNDLSAYKHYLEALGESRDGYFFDRDRNARIVGHLQKAIQRDPNFALALARLSDAYASGAWFRHFVAKSEENERIIQRLTEILGPDHYIVHRTRGIYLYHGRRDLIGALPSLRAAAKINPSDATTNAFLGFIERRLGNQEQARYHLEAALQVDPFFVPVMTILAHVYASLGEWDTLADFLRGPLGNGLGDDGIYRLSIAQIYNKYAINSDVVVAVIRENQSFMEDAVLHQYWFVSGGKDNAYAFYGDLDRAAQKRVAAAIEGKANPTVERQFVRRALIGRAVLAASFKDQTEVNRCLRELEANQVLNGSKARSRIAYRQEAEKLMYLRIKGDDQRARQMSKQLEAKADQYEDRLAAAEIYSDLARGAIVARDVHTLTRLLRKGKEASPEANILAAVMKMPSFNEVESTAELQDLVAAYRKSLPRIDAVFRPIIGERYFSEVGNVAAR